MGICLTFLFSSLSLLHVNNVSLCGLNGSVPPNIYKKVKGVPDDKRETILVKELEGILSREGLSKNPTEKGNK